MEIQKPYKMTLKEKSSKIEEIYNNSLLQLNKLEKMAIIILKNINKKREQKRIEDLNKELKK